MKLKAMQEKFKDIKVIIITAIVVLVAVLILGVILIGRAMSTEPELFVVTESSLKEIIKIDELSTLEFFYNSIATAKAEDSDKVKYYVAYEGTVRYGVEFEKVEISVDNEKKEIHITVPEIKVMDCEVNQETMDFIFTKSGYETETVLTEAYSICKSDLESKAAQETSLISMAKDNAIMSIEALVHPWIEQVDEAYSVIVE